MDNNNWPFKMCSILADDAQKQKTSLGKDRCNKVRTGKVYDFTCKIETEQVKSYNEN